MRTLLLIAAYASGLVVLVLTKHRDSMRIGLIRLGLLRLDGSKSAMDRCQRSIPFTRGMTLYAGQGLRSCSGRCEDCDAHYLIMHDNGKLSLYHGSSGNIVWQVSSRQWWRKTEVRRASSTFDLSTAALGLGKVLGADRPGRPENRPRRRRHLETPARQMQAPTRAHNSPRRRRAVRRAYADADVFGVPSSEERCPH